MEVLLKACASGGAYIEPHIEPFGLRDFTQEMLGMVGEVPDIKGLFSGEVLHAPGSFIRDHHEVTRGVGVFVED